MQRSNRLEEQWDGLQRLGVVSPADSRAAATPAIWLCKDLWEL